MPGRALIRFNFLPICALTVLACGLLAPGIARAGTAMLVDDEVRYYAAPGEANRLWILFVPGEGIQVIDRHNSVTARKGCISINTDAAFCERRRRTANLSLILVFANDMDDRVRIDAEARLVHLRGGAEHDDLQGDAESKNVLDGGQGADVLRASWSPDAWDVIDYSSRRRSVHVTIGDGHSNDGRRGEGDLVTNGIEEVRGGFGNDRLDGEANRDLLKGGPGQDELRGHAGRDGLLGGRGRDIFFALDGAQDRVTGGAGHDRASIDTRLDLVWAIEELF